MLGMKCTGRTRVDGKEKLNFRSFTAEDVCSILRVCAKTGVKVLKFLDLEVEFSETKNSKPDLAAKTNFPDAAMSEDKQVAPLQTGPV